MNRFEMLANDHEVLISNRVSLRKQSVDKRMIKRECMLEFLPDSIGGIKVYVQYWGVRNMN